MRRVEARGRTGSALASAARDALLVAALGALLTLAGGALAGALAGVEQIDAHGYWASGFTRSAFATLCEAVRDGRATGQVLAPWIAVTLGVGAFLFSLRAGSLGDARAAHGALRSPTFAAWSALAVSLLALAALSAVRIHRPWFGARDFAFAACFTLVWTVLLAWGSRRARESDSAQSAAHSTAFLAAAAVLLGPSFWFGSALIHAPRDPRPWSALFAVMLAAGLVYLWVRARSRRALEGARVSGWNSPQACSAAASALVLAASFVLPRLERSFGPPALRAARPHNVVILALDTVRMDATSIFGPNVRGRDTTPNLRRLAQRGVAFENAISQAPWTLPAFASMLTGRYPHEHGAYLITGQLRRAETTLAELLREADYATGAAISQYYLRKGSGFEQGCDIYDESGMTRVDESGAERTSDAALRVLEQLTAGGERPFFEFVHYYDPHANYLDHAEFDWSDGYSGWLREQNDIENFVRCRQMLDEADRRFIVDRFDEELAFTDRQLGRLLDEFDRRDLWKDTLVLAVVDHGEQFLDHGGFEHTVDVYEELVRVPLILVPPGSAAASRFSDVVETRDVFATVLDELDLDCAAEVRKRSLLARVRAGADPLAHAFTITWPEDAEPSWGVRSFVSGLREGRWKAIRDWTRDRRMLFDLESDPRETVDVAAREPERARELFERLERWTTEQRAGSSGAARGAHGASGIQQLQSLGYMGGR